MCQGPGYQDVTPAHKPLPNSCTSHPSSNNTNGTSLTHSYAAAHNVSTGVTCARALLTLTSQSVTGPSSPVIPAPSLGEKGPVMLEYEAILAELTEILGPTS